MSDPIQSAALALLRVMEANVLTPEQFRMLGTVKKLAGVPTNRELANDLWDRR